MNYEHEDRYELDPDEVYLVKIYDLEFECPGSFVALQSCIQFLTGDSLSEGIISIKKSCNEVIFLWDDSGVELIENVFVKIHNRLYKLYCTKEKNRYVRTLYYYMNDFKKSVKNS
jgi:hypothetical protein